MPKTCDNNNKTCESHVQKLDEKSTNKTIFDKIHLTRRIWIRSVLRFEGAIVSTELTRKIAKNNENKKKNHGNLDSELQGHGDATFATFQKTLASHVHVCACVRVRMRVYNKKSKIL